jgi:hypothetical protein
VNKRTKTIGELFASPAFDEAVKRAVRQAIRENAALDRLRKPRKAKAASKGRRRAA